MLNTRIASLRQEYVELTDFLNDKSEISFSLYINNCYKKNLVISAASYFEAIITEIIIEYIKTHTNQNKKITTFIEGHALSRQFHTLFDWSVNNTNKFFKLFGDETKNEAMEKIESQKLHDAEKAFISICSLRNKIVHKNFIEASIDPTFDEIYNNYELACKYIQLVREVLPAA